MISAVKAAEKFIPKETESKGLAKADAALDYFIKSYEKAKGKKPSKKLITDVILGLPVVHEKVETNTKDK